MSYTVQAQAYWTQETLLLEESMQTYLSTTRRAVGHVYISHLLPAGWLLTLLSLKTRPTVEDTSFDYFRKLIPFWSKSDPRQMAFRQARLSVNHPRPDPLPALRLFQKAKNPDWHRWLALCLNPAGKDSSIMEWTLFIDTAQLLARKGRLDDAKWVLDLGRDMLPLRFQMGRPSKAGLTTTERRLATPEEAAAGLVDSEGYFLSMKKRTSAYANGVAASTWRPDRRGSDSPFPDQ